MALTRDRRLCWSALLALMLAGMAGAHAATYTVGVENVDYYPHYGIRKERYSGYARDLLDAFAARHGHQFRYVVLPVRRLSIAFLQDQSLDFKFPDNPAWVPELRSKQKVIYSSSVIDVIEGTMVRPEHKGKPVERIKVLGTILGFTPKPYLSAIQSGKMRLTENSDFSRLIQQTLVGRVDGAYINVAVGAAILKDQLKTPGALVFDPALPYASHGFSLSTLKHGALIREFNQFLAQEKQLQLNLCAKYGMPCQPGPAGQIHTAPSFDE